jgi:hypothetical protein
MPVAAWQVWCLTSPAHTTAFTVAAVGAALAASAVRPRGGDVDAVLDVVPDGPAVLALSPAAE